MGDDYNIYLSKFRDKAHGRPVVLRLRYMFDLTVNGIVRPIIMAVAPIMLSTEEPLDFIKDALALFFITQLDDFDDAKTPCQCVKTMEEEDKLRERLEGLKNPAKDEQSTPLLP